MTTTDFTFHLPEEQVHPIPAESNDFFSNNGLSSNYFLPLEDQKQPFHAEDRIQQRQKTYYRIIRKLTEGNLPGKEHAVSYLQHKYRRNLRRPEPSGPAVIPSSIFYYFYKKTVD